MLHSAALLLGLPCLQKYNLGVSSIQRVNPYKPSILFVAHWQTVQNQIRHRITWHLIRFSTVCLQKCLLNLKKKNPTQQPLKRNGLVQMIIVGNSIRLKWVKHAWSLKFGYLGLSSLSQPLSSIEVCVCNPCDPVSSMWQTPFHTFTRAGSSGKKWP